MRSLSILLTLLLFHSCFSQQVTLIQTAKDTGDRLTVKPSVYFNSSTSSFPSLSVDPTKTYQTIHGFGGAFTEASALVWGSLRSDLKEEVLNAYYGPYGLGYSTGRVHINSCDFSTGNYSCDDIDGDFELKNFALTTHDTEVVIPMVLQALKYHYSWSETEMKIFASPWSPPAWMKQNGEMDGSSPIGLKDGDSYHSSWALFFSKFITSYEEKGVPIWGVTVQNEPSNNPRWEACCYTSESERDFLRDFLGPQLRKDHPDIKIMIFDDQKDILDEWLSVILADPQTSQYVDGIGVHWYTGDYFSALDIAHNQFPEPFILATEACIDQPPIYNDWSRGERYGHDILGDLLNWAVGWTDWNILLDQDGGPNHVGNYCDAPILANISASESEQLLHYQITYYYMGHFSKYIPRGSVRIAMDIDSELTQLETIAFLTPQNNVVVIVLNRNDESYQFNIKQGGRTLSSLTVPNRSIQTYIYPNF